MSILLSTLLAASCKPSVEELAKAEVRRQEYCLNHACAHDIQPRPDPATEFAFKRNGRWFIGPREYYNGDGITGFYWPSKTPIYTSSQDSPEEKDLRSGGLSNVAVDVFVGSLPPNLPEMYPEVLERAVKQYGIASREILRPGLERVIKSRDPGYYTHLYVASNAKTPAGVPALVACNPRDFCSMRFAWNGLTVDVRFGHRHAHDWPEIFIEVLHILTLLREEVK